MAGWGNSRWYIGGSCRRSHNFVMQQAEGSVAMSRPKISSADFVYRPWSEARRRAASKAAIARSGAKPGHRILYGIQVPENHWDGISYAAHQFRQKNNLIATKRYIRYLMPIFKRLV